MSICFLLVAMIVSLYAFYIAYVKPFSVWFSGKQTARQLQTPITVQVTGGYIDCSTILPNIANSLVDPNHINGLGNIWQDDFYIIQTSEKLKETAVNSYFILPFAANVSIAYRKNILDVITHNIVDGLVVATLKILQKKEINIAVVCDETIATKESVKRTRPVPHIIFGRDLGYLRKQPLNRKDNIMYNGQGKVMVFYSPKYFNNDISVPYIKLNFVVQQTI
jgi:hypothetical protein